MPATIPPTLPATLPVSQWLVRAERAIAQGPVIYWLGAGGLNPDAAQPGEDCQLVLDQGESWDKSLFASVRKNARSLATLYDKSQDIMVRYQRPACMALSACDCSGFICWVMGISGVQNGFRVTTTMLIDDAAKGPNAQRFKRLDRPVPGCLWIYKKGEADEVGHVALVRRLNAQGKVAEFIDCSGDSFREHGSAIRARASDVFDKHDSWYLTVR
jgi:hypothetical protein